MQTRGWDKNFAAVVSLMGSPPVLTIVAMATLAWQSFKPGVWNWVWLHAVVAVIVPLAYLVQLVRRGRVSDIDIESRKERFGPLGVTVFCTAVAWLVFHLRGAPAPMTILAGVLFAQTAIIFAITFFWKISVHCAFAGLAGILAGGLTGSAAPAVVTVTLVSWSRWRLDQHTPAQAVAGTLLGVLSAVIVGALS